jgi:hypothetical protein
MQAAMFNVDTGGPILRYHVIPAVVSGAFGATCVVHMFWDGCFKDDLHVQTHFFCWIDLHLTGSRAAMAYDRDTQSQGEAISLLSRCIGQEERRESNLD